MTDLQLCKEGEEFFIQLMNSDIFPLSGENLFDWNGIQSSMD